MLFQLDNLGFDLCLKVTVQLKQFLLGLTQFRGTLFNPAFQLSIVLV